MYSNVVDAPGFLRSSLEHLKAKKPLRSVTCKLPWASLELSRSIIGAGNETRTRDLNLGKVALYQLSYSRGGQPCPKPRRNCRAPSAGVKKNNAPIDANALNYTLFLPKSPPSIVKLRPIGIAGVPDRPATLYRVELPRNSGQARRRYAIMDHRVSTTAMAVRPNPRLYTGMPKKF
jgi:hypothetical protein